MGTMGGARGLHCKARLTCLQVYRTERGHRGGGARSELQIETLQLFIVDFDTILASLELGMK